MHSYIMSFILPQWLVKILSKIIEQISIVFADLWKKNSYSACHPTDVLISLCILLHIWSLLAAHDVVISCTISYYMWLCEDVSMILILVLLNFIDSKRTCTLYYSLKYMEEDIVSWSYRFFFCYSFNGHLSKISIYLLLKLFF